MNHHLSSFLFALALVLTSAALISWHLRMRSVWQEQEMPDRERDFRRRQFRRRIQTSAMLGVLGVAIFVGQLLMGRVHWVLFPIIYWSCVLLLVLWLALLAVADMVATNFYYSREKSEFAAEQAKLQAELRKFREEEARRKNDWPGMN
jgi:UDP-N-acetylmuramyl pentapeptide phosphotransferase/UDP-N-acetylglucosamine-1-phosphate transferase